LGFLQNCHSFGRFKVSVTFGLARDGGFSLRDRAAKIAAGLLEISISELNELQTAQQQNLPTLSQAQGREAASAKGTS